MRLVPTTTILSLSAGTSPPPQTPVPDVVEVRTDEERPIAGSARFSARRAVRRPFLRTVRIRSGEDG